MLNLTFAEQVKIVLGRKNMTIKDLAELFEKRTGKKMSRQNMTQRLGRDNFQEQDMRIIAELLECPFQLSILEDAETGRVVRYGQPARRKRKKTPQRKTDSDRGRDVTVGELMDMMEDIPSAAPREYQPVRNAVRQEKTAEDRTPGIGAFFRGIRREAPRRQQPDFESYVEPEDLVNGDVNPKTGHEYESNTVRRHPERIGYVQVYDRSEHCWTDMTEWAFLGFQERKKALLGKDYEPPFYLD